MPSATSLKRLDRLSLGKPNSYGWYARLTDFWVVLAFLLPWPVRLSARTQPSQG